MPLIRHSSFRAPRFLDNAHFQTVWPSFVRRVRDVDYLRERIELADGDFLDLDWSRVGARCLVIVTHGLEGNSRRPYVRGMVRAFNREGWDAVAWNFRACSGEPNRLLRLYHSGATEDLLAVWKHAESSGRYDRIALVSFSLGANLTLKFAAEFGEELAHRLGAVVGFSVPCDLASAADRMAEPGNRFYMQYFLKAMRRKVRMKIRQFPDRIDDADYGRMSSFWDFDNRYTAPLHGFRDAIEYYSRCSCRPHLGSIPVPTLVVNSRDDPFLANGCFPVSEAESSERLHLESPDRGGHTGYWSFGHRGEYWSERRAVEFVREWAPR